MEAIWWGQSGGGNLVGAIWQGQSDGGNLAGAIWWRQSGGGNLAEGVCSNPLAAPSLSSALHLLLTRIIKIA